MKTGTQPHRLTQLWKLAEARKLGAEGYYELGVAYAMGDGGALVDLVQAHKWFNLAAMAGMREAQEDRASIAADMSAAEIAEAQRAARSWLTGRAMARAA